MNNNPINAHDPSGHKCVGEPAECLKDNLKPINGSGGGDKKDRRDLTSWMPNGLELMANDPVIFDIAGMNSYLEYPDAGLLEFKALVRDNARFDIKRKMWQMFGETSPIKLGSYWYESSTAGNIAYGFYAAAAGYDSSLIHAGAGWAQFKDAYIDHDGPAGEPKYLMDTEDDYFAVKLGIELYVHDYLPDGDITQQEFVNRLDHFEYHDQLTVMAAPGDFQPLIGGPYSDDEFFVR